MPGLGVDSGAPAGRFDTAAGTPLLEQARKTAATAAGLVSSDPYSAYVLA